MTSEQQINLMFGKDNIYVYTVTCNDAGALYYRFVVKVYVNENWYCVGIGRSRYTMFTDALIKTGGKRISGSGNYQKNKL